MTSVSAQTRLWFLNTLVKIRVPHVSGRDQIAVLEHLAPFGDSPPLHIHRNQDEGFIVLEGNLRVLMDGKETTASAGDFMLAPQGLPHSYRVLSDTARFVTITRGPDFEGLVRHLGRPAPRDELPAPAPPPTPDQIAGLVAACKTFGIDVVGPPLLS
jgi:quercetin dioxygenase-like cupin family protein